jgi:hypothetical protein
MKVFACLLFLLVFFPAFSQQDNFEKIYRELEERGEVYFIFPSSADSVHFFSRILSVDNYINDSIYAYANKKQFIKFLDLKIPFRHLLPPSLQIQQSRLKNATNESWNYPSYDEYVRLMQNFALNYPFLCTLVEIGESEKGKKLLSVKLSGPSVTEGKPSVFYTAGIHGDEGSGVVLMLKLIDYLLNRYGFDEKVTLLLNSCYVFINPLSNPDGFYFLSNESNYGATRFNINSVDLNRNFPDFLYGDHPDENAWQAETVAMMDFMKENRFILSANFHDGVEVVNYPWDNWQKLHADNDWFVAISAEYADTVHKYSEDDYFKFRNNGITNGFQWYSITGGRMDYVTWFLRGREVTIELSGIKSPDAGTIELLWNYNRNSLINYLLNAIQGVRGYVYDRNTGERLEAAINVINYDRDNSHVFSNEGPGEYYRMLLPGEYLLQGSSSGYVSKVVPITIPSEGYAVIDFDLVKREGILLNPVNGTLQISLTDSIEEEIRIEIFDLSGRLVLQKQQEIFAPEVFLIDIAPFYPGFYILRLNGKTIKREYKFIRR